MPRILFYKNLRRHLRSRVAFVIFIILGISVPSFSGLFSGFSVSTVSATSTGSSRVAVTLSDIITLRILDSSVSSEISNLILDVTPTPNGVFTKNSMIVEAATSNPTGYKLYMTSIGTNPVSDASDNPTYTTNLINTDSSVSDNIPTLAADSSVTEADFRVRNSLYKNKWGYSLASLDITDTSSITYTNIPEHSTNHEIGSNNEASDSDLTPVTIGVNVSSSIASGTYKNKLEFTAIANPIPADYGLSFNANLDSLSTWSINIPEEQSITSVASSYTFTIPSDIPISRSNFKEYNTKVDGTGDAYQPGDSIELIGDTTNPDATKLTLYVIWEDCDAPEGGFCDTNGHMWTGVLKRKVTYANIGSPCPSGYTIPTLAEYNNLIAKDINVTIALYSIGASIYWSTTPKSNDSNYRYGLFLNEHAYTALRYKDNTIDVVCTK